MLHESSSLLGSCCVAGVPSDVVLFCSLNFFLPLTSSLDENAAPPPTGAVGVLPLVAGKSGSAVVGIGLSEYSGTRSGPHEPALTLQCAALDLVYAAL